MGRRTQHLRTKTDQFPKRCVSRIPDDRQSPGIQTVAFKCFGYPSCIITAWVEWRRATHIFQILSFLLCIPHWPWCSFTTHTDSLLQVPYCAASQIIFPCISLNTHLIVFLQTKARNLNDIYILCQVPTCTVDRWSSISPSCKVGVILYPYILKLSSSNNF
jgi:hypothetical protein